MRNLVTALLSVLAVSAIFIGCDFVDSNSARVRMDDPTAVSASFDGYYTTGLDTAGHDGP